MDDIQITPGRQRRRLLLFSSVLFGIVTLVDLLWMSILSRSRAAREPNGSLQLGFLELVSAAIVLGVLFTLPAFLVMAFFKRLRCFHYFGAVVAFGVAGAGILACVYYNIDMNPDPFPWRAHVRAHVLEDTLRGAFGGFLLGVIGSSCLAPFALLVLPRQRAMPQEFRNEEIHLSAGAVLHEYETNDESAIQKSW